MEGHHFTFGTRQWHPTQDGLPFLLVHVQAANCSAKYRQGHRHRREYDFERLSHFGRHFACLGMAAPRGTRVSRMGGPLEIHYPAVRDSKGPPSAPYFDRSTSPHWLRTSWATRFGLVVPSSRASGFPSGSQY